MAQEVGGIIVPIGANIRGLVTNTRKAAASIRTMADKGSKSLAKLEAKFAKAQKAAMKLKNAAALLTGVLVFKSVITAGLQMEKMTSKLMAATGSAEAAAIEMRFLNHEVDRLGLQLSSAGDDFGTLAASAKGTAMEGKGVRDIFLAVAEASTVLKLSAADTSGSIRAISQIMSKGSVQAEELRGQLGERLPAAFQIAARGMGKTTAELSKMLEMGQVGADDFLPKFAAAIRSTYADQVPNAVNSAQASINRFNNAIFRLKSDIASGGILDGFTASLDFLSQTAIPNVSVALAILTADVLKEFETYRRESRKLLAWIDSLNFTIDIDPEGILAGIGRATGFLSDINKDAKTYEQTLSDINAEYDLMIKSINDIVAERFLSAMGGAEAPIPDPIVTGGGGVGIGMSKEEMDKRASDAAFVVSLAESTAAAEKAARDQALKEALEAEQKILDAAVKAADIKKMLAWSIAGNAIQAARALFGDSKALIIAGIVLEKANALAKNAMWTAEGATAAAAAAAPMGPLAATAAGLKFKALGAVNAALIVATGLGQAFSSGGSGGGGGGSVGSAGAASTLPSLAAETRESGPRDVILNVSIEGDVMDAKEFFARHAEDIKDLVGQGIDLGMVPESQ